MSRVRRRPVHRLNGDVPRTGIWSGGQGRVLDFPPLGVIGSIQGEERVIRVLVEIDRPIQRANGPEPNRLPGLPQHLPIAGPKGFEDVDMFLVREQIEMISIACL